MAVAAFLLAMAALALNAWAVWLVSTKAPQPRRRWETTGAKHPLDGHTCPPGGCPTAEEFMAQYAADWNARVQAERTHQ